MKRLVFVWVLVLTFNAKGMWFPVGKSGANVNYAKKSVCEKLENHECFDISGKDVRYHEVKSVQVDDKTKPIWKPKYNVVSCGTDQECVEKMAELGGNSHCNSGDEIKYSKNTLMPGFSIYCTKVTGYEKKTVKKLVENASAKAAVQSADAAKAQEQAALEQAMKHQSFGKKMQAYIAVRNRQKSLTVPQVKQMTDTYGPIQSLLLSGSIETAKAQIQAITPDGTLVTQADKDAVLAEINAYLGN